MKARIIPLGKYYVFKFLKIFSYIAYFFCILTKEIQGGSKYLAFPAQGSLTQTNIILPFHKLCDKIRQITIRCDNARPCSCFISRAYPKENNLFEQNLNSWCNAFNYALKRSGIHTFYDEFGYFSLNDEVYPFINQIGSVNAVFPLLTPAFKERTESRVGWLFDEVQCFTARRARNPNGCHPILLSGTKETSVPSQLLPLENSYYYTMTTNTDHHDLPWPTARSFIDVMLEILTPNDKGITRWTKQSARAEISEAVNNYRKHFLKQHTTQRQFETIPSANLHDLMIPHIGKSEHTSMVENVSHMIDSFYHSRKDEQGENYVSVISRKLNSVAQDPNPALIRALHICGIGGAGKTYLARHFAYRSFQKKTYDLIWWFDDDNFQESIKKLYKAMRKALFSIPPDLTDNHSQFMAIQTALNLTTKNWLLIYDNISMRTITKKRIFQCTNNQGHILTTTRYMNRGQFLNLNEFTKEEAVEYLQNHIQQTNQEYYENNDSLLDHVANKLLFRLPLALAQAASYIAAQDITLQQYVEDFSQDTTLLLNYENEAEFSVPIYRSLVMTLEKISAQACQLFFMLCFMPADDVPMYIFEAMCENKYKFREIYKELQTQRLITISGKDSFLFSSMHRLYQFIGKRIFLNNSEPDQVEKIAQLNKDFILFWNTFLECFDKFKIEQSNAKKWYILLKAFLKCLEKKIPNTEEQKKIDRTHPLHEDPSLILDIEFLPISFSISDLIEFILSKFQDEPDFEQLIWEETGIQSEHGEEVREEVYQMSTHLKCSKLVIYKILKKHNLIKKNKLKALLPYYSNNNYLWDLEFFFKVIDKATGSEKLFDTILLYMDLIMEKKRSYPGFASSFALYILHKTKTQKSINFDSLHKMVEPDYTLHLYLEAERNYTCSSYVDTIEVIELIKDFQEIYRTIEKNIPLHKTVCYIPVLYCYGKFGTNFIKRHSDQINVFVDIYNKRDVKELTKTY